MDQMPPVTTRQRPPSPRPRRFSVAEYDRMADAGILAQSDHVELVEGVIVAMAAIRNRHISTVIALTQELTAALGRLANVSVQNPVRLDDESEPEPDIAVLKPRPDRYAADKPRSGDVLLLAEVADSSLDYDRSTKRALYARSGIAEYWVVDLVDDRVEVCRGPGPDGYASVVPVGLRDALAVPGFPGTAIAVADVIPPR